MIDNNNVWMAIAELEYKLNIENKRTEIIYAQEISQWRERLCDNRHSPTDANEDKLLSSK